MSARILRLWWRTEGHFFHYFLTSVEVFQSGKTFSCLVHRSQEDVFHLVRVGSNLNGTFKLAVRIWKANIFFCHWIYIPLWLLCCTVTKKKNTLDAWNPGCHLFLHTFDSQIFTVLSLEGERGRKRVKEREREVGWWAKESKENTTKRKNNRTSIRQSSFSKQPIVHQTQHKETDFKVLLTHMPTHTSLKTPSPVSVRKHHCNLTDRLQTKYDSYYATNKSN